MRRPQATAPRCQLLSFYRTWCVCLAFVKLNANCIRWMSSVHIYVIRCMNSMLYICYKLLICSLEFWLTECRMCFELETKCRFLFSSDGWADVSLSVATVAPSSDGRMTSTYPSLLENTVATDVFCPSLLCYHCRDALVATGRVPVDIVTYGSLLQCLFIVVVGIWNNYYLCNFL
jgi:hypothetical protein